MEERDPSIADHYDALAEVYDEFAVKPTREHILWPAMRALLPEVADKEVLDAGCGSGYYSSWFDDHGAEVVGIDASQGMLQFAQDQYDDSITFRQADLQARLEFVDDRFDLVFCQHVISHLPDLEVVFSEFARVLKSGGILVLSTHHPFHDFLIVREQKYPDLSEAWGSDLDPVVEPLDEETNYHETQAFNIYWGGSESDNPNRYYRRPLRGLLKPLLSAGFALDDLIEPTPDSSFEEEFPDLSQEMVRHPPEALCLRAVV